VSTLALGRAARQRLGRLGPVLVIALSTTACVAGTDADSSSVPAGLLSAEQVGGVTGDPVVDPELYSTTPCGPDSAVLWPFGDEGTGVRYPRSDGSVTIGVWPVSPDSQASLRTFRANATAPRCRHGSTGTPDDTGPPNDRWSVSLLRGFPPGVVAFEAVRIVNEGPTEPEPGEDTMTVGRHTFARAYQLVDGQLVTVWLHRSDGIRPSVEELRELLDAQVGLARGS